MAEIGENMAKEVKTNAKENRISAEKARLNEIFGGLPENKKKLAAGLIERAAFMRVELEDLEAYLKENGWTEPFQQSEKVLPYDRARPQGQTYQTMNANYQKIVKQLHDMLPEKAMKDEDSFDGFLSERDQM